MTQLVAATGAFLLTHFASSTPLRGALVRRMGEGPYLGLYSLVAAATLGWMTWAYAAAPRQPVFDGLRVVPLVVMPVALVLIVCGYWRNPTMVGAGKLLTSDDPARGIIRITRHPLMWGLILFTLSHVAATGDLRAMVLFGGLFALAAVGTVSIDAKKRSNPDYARFEAVTSNVPFVANAQGRNRLAWREIGLLRPAIALVLYPALLALHPWLFGVRPW